MGEEIILEDLIKVLRIIVNKRINLAFLTILVKKYDSDTLVRLTYNKHQREWNTLTVEEFQLFKKVIQSCSLDID